MRQVAANAVYGQLAVAYSPSAFPAQLKITVQSVNPFPALKAGQFFPFVINPSMAGLTASGGLPDNNGGAAGYTERGLACISSISAGVLTATILPLKYAHGVGDVVVCGMTAKSGDYMAGEGGIVNGPLDSPSMATWANALGNATQSPASGPAILWLLQDSFGSDYADGYSGLRNALSQKYNGAPAAVGLTNINGQIGTRPWPTVAGTTNHGHGISGYMQTMATPGQVCTSPSWLMDGVQFHWLADSAGAAGALALQVDGVTVATVDSSKTGHLYYATPGGAGFHTIGYLNAGSGSQSVTVDSPYVYLNNRNSGVQIWEISHVVQETAFYGGTATGIVLCQITAGSNSLTPIGGGTFPAGIQNACMVTADGIAAGTTTTGAGGGSTIGLSTTPQVSKVAFVTFHALANGLLLGTFSTAGTNPGYPYLAQQLTVTLNGTTAVTCNGTTMDFLKAGLVTGMPAVAAGIFQPGTTITVNSATSITLSKAALVSGSFNVGFQRVLGASGALNGAGGSVSQAPAAVIVCTATNDVFYNDNSDYGVSYRAALDGILGVLQAFGGISMTQAGGSTVLPTSLGLFFPYGTPNNGRGDYSPWELQALDFCLSNGCSLFDARAVVGDIVTGTGSSSGEDAAGWAFDGLHPTLVANRQLFTPGLLRLVDIGAPNAAAVAAGGSLVCPGTAWTIVGTESKVVFTNSASGVSVSVSQPQDLFTFAANQTNIIPYLAQPQVQQSKKITLIQGGTQPVSLATVSGNIRGTTSTAGQYKGLELTPLSATEWLSTPIG